VGLAEKGSGRNGIPADLKKMMAEQLSTQLPVTAVRALLPADLGRNRLRLETYLVRGGNSHLSRHPAWLPILERSMGHTPYCLEAVRDEQTTGFLLLAHVRSLLFGRFLVSLPYVNYGGPIADDEATARGLIDHAVQLADRLGVRYLELRNERAISHPALTASRTDKVHMRLNLPAKADLLWDGLSAKVRNQVRKGQKSELTFISGGAELLSEYYTVFSENMRDLGTPVFGRGLFGHTLRELGDRAELCVVRTAQQPVAAALLLHGWGVTEVPSASCLRKFNHTCANMLLYWNLLERAIARAQSCFDFGRSSKDSNTFRFKKQWGAEPVQAAWQYYVRSGHVSEMRQDNPRYQRLIRAWQRLPVWLTRLIGPSIVRGIP
jgi:FemAB-related protein (PEP-CTERM system-associated)